MANIIDIIAVLMMVTSFAVFGLRQYRHSIQAYALQTLLLVMIFLALYFKYGTHELLIWAITAFVIKVLFVPFYLLRLVKKLGVGFLREFLDATESRFAQEIRKRFKKDKKELSDLFNELVIFEAIEEKSKEDYIRIVDLYKKIDEKEHIVRLEKKNFKDSKRTKYVKRDAVSKIIAAWIITVPAAAILSAAIFFMIKGIMIP
jgi:hypothetical protein